MKYLSSFFLLLALFLSACQEQNKFPSPTQGKTIINQLGEADGDEKERWIEDMHWSAPTDNWKNIEAATRYKRHQVRSQSRSSGNKSTQCNQTSYANGEISGQWCERGSNNQAGSLGPMYFDATINTLYAISAGGTIWRGSINGSSWQPINDDLRFDWNIIKKISVGSGNRLIAVRNKILHYSDDEGNSWIASTGLETYSDNWGRRDRTIALDDSNSTIYMLMQEWNPGPWQSEVSIYKSTDQGVSFAKDMNFGPVSLDDMDMINPHNSSDLYLLHRESNSKLNTYKLNTSTGNIELINTANGLGFSNLGTLTGVVQNGQTHLYTYSSDQVYYSNDDGASWTYKGTLPDSPWAVGLNVSASDYTHLFSGGFECYRSHDSGQNWTKFNDWGAYYSDPVNDLHADIMSIQFFKKSDNTDFMLISNHGGISISNDAGLSTQNIGMSGLNVSQYYSVATSPINTGQVYAGSQDQGFQRTQMNANNCLQDFEQAISGDYGHLVFNDDGGLWIVYPDGWISYWANPANGGIFGDYTIESSNEAAWIPFMMESPYPNERAIFVAGGSATGGAGSYIMKLTYSNLGVTAVNHSNFNFRNSGGVISAIEVSPLDNNKWYAATSNGKFFYSNDGGISWAETGSFTGPEQHYLYGSSILASSQDANTVYLAGSGYSNPGVYVSTNGGISFTPMDAGLPPTLVFKVAADGLGNNLFAATEAGPYVYSFDTGSWFDMLGDCAPAQTYWSVEYVEQDNIVRFGTYGRGIWDFELLGVGLDVEWLSFTANLNTRNQVDINWVTASELNNDFFILERSQDGRTFESIEIIESKNNSSTEQSYATIDPKPLRGTSYYRLKQVNLDGSSTYSDQAVINIQSPITTKVFPNPIRTNQSLTVEGDFGGIAEFYLYNTNGMLVNQNKVSDQSTIDLKQLASGQYFYKIVFEGGQESGKIQVLQ